MVPRAYPHLKPKEKTPEDKIKDLEWRLANLEEALKKIKSRVGTSTEAWHLANDALTIMGSAH